MPGTVVGGIMVTATWATMTVVTPALAKVQPDAPRPSPKAPREKSPTHDAAVAILAKADAAIKRVKGVRYHAVVTAGGVRAKYFPKISGTAAFYGDLSEGFRHFFFDVTLQPADGGSTRRLTTGGNGEMFFLIDWHNHSAYEDMDIQVIGADGRREPAITMIESIHPPPFIQEIAGERDQLLDTVLGGMQACTVMHFVAGVYGQEATWYFSKKDFLPRRVRRSFPIQPGKRAYRDYVITDLEVDPAFDELLFKLALPKGFKKKDEFAPARQIPW